MLKVIQYLRRPRPLGNFSIEYLFEEIRSLAPSDIEITPIFSKYYSNGIIKRIYNIIEAYFHQGDVNHVTGDVHFLTLLLSKRKTILTIHDCGMLKQMKGLKLWITKLLWFTLPASKASVITVNSEYTKQDLLSYVKIDPKKIKVIHFFIKDHFRRYNKEFNISKPNILQIGTAENKNLRRVIPALKDISCTYTIVGKVNDEIRSLLIQNNVDYNTIERAVSDLELLDLYRSCDIVCFVSTLEGFGLPIIEANAVGRVVLTSNVASMPEIANNAAHLVDPLSIASIHAGLEKIIQDTPYRNQLIQQGYNNAIKYSSQLTAGKYFELYRKFYSNLKLNISGF